MSTDALPALDPRCERYILSHAYIPEHIPALMTSVFHAVPFLIDDNLGFAKDNRAIFDGYSVAQVST